MGLQPIFKCLHWFQWEQNRKCHCRAVAALTLNLSPAWPSFEVFGSRGPPGSPNLTISQGVWILGSTRISEPDYLLMCFDLGVHQVLWTWPSLEVFESQGPPGYLNLTISQGVWISGSTRISEPDHLPRCLNLRVHQVLWTWPSPKVFESQGPPGSLNLTICWFVWISGSTRISEPDRLPRCLNIRVHQVLWTWLSADVFGSRGPPGSPNLTISRGVWISGSTRFSEPDHLLRLKNRRVNLDLWTWPSSEVKESRGPPGSPNLKICCCAGNMKAHHLDLHTRCEIFGISFDYLSAMYSMDRSCMTRRSNTTEIPNFLQMCRSSHLAYIFFSENCIKMEKNRTRGGGAP